MGRSKKSCFNDVKLNCINQLLDGKPFNEVCANNDVSPSSLLEWKRVILSNSFGSKALKSIREERDEYKALLERARFIIEKKNATIELLNKRLALSKKNLLWSLVDEDNEYLSISEQCKLIGLPRSVYYDRLSKKDVNAAAEAERNRLHNLHCDITLKEWSNHSTYGYSKMAHHLLEKGYTWASEHKIRMIYKQLGLKGQCSRKSPSKTMSM